MFNGNQTENIILADKKALNFNENDAFNHNQNVTSHREKSLETVGYCQRKSPCNRTKKLN